MSAYTSSGGASVADGASAASSDGAARETPAIADGTARETPTVDTCSEEIELMLPYTSTYSADDALGYFDNGIQCVFEDRIPKECNSFYEKYTRCPAERRLSEVHNSTEIQILRIGFIMVV
jgi:hypothetical protein